MLVVDESVNGHSLAINGAPVDTTPWLSSRPVGVFNYGIASAISNLCSSSNLLLQTGLPLSAFPDRELRALRVANVFAYLAAAGYRTAFIDAQTYSDQPPNLMTGFDLERIDTRLRLREKHRGIPEYEFDLLALPELRALIEGNARSFVYLLKTGAHLPYADKSPADRRPFQPALEAWEVSGDPVRTRNSYWNAMLWTVDHFLAELSRELTATGREVLVIYTSDHGQWLPGDPDGGGSSRRTRPRWIRRCSRAGSAAAAGVRAAHARRGRGALRSAARRSRERLRIFPTVLQAAGYSAADTRRFYPPSLFESEAERPPRAFLSGNIFARDGGYYVLTNQWNPDLGSACYVNAFSSARSARRRPRNRKPAQGHQRPEHGDRGKQVLLPRQLLLHREREAAATSQKPASIRPAKRSTRAARARSRSRRAPSRSRARAEEHAARARSGRRDDWWSAPADRARTAPRDRARGARRARSAARAGTGRRRNSTASTTTKNAPSPVSA